MTLLYFVIKFHVELKADDENSSIDPQVILWNTCTFGALYRSARLGLIGDFVEHFMHIWTFVIYPLPKYYYALADYNMRTKLLKYRDSGISVNDHIKTTSSIETR